MKVIFIIFCTLFFYINCNFDMDKSIQLLNGKWLFCYDPDNIGETLGYAESSKDRADWSSVNIPSFWNDENYDGFGWYATVFTLSSKLKNKNIALVFDSIDDNAVVYLNGKRIYEHIGYGIRFYKIITDQLDRDRKNLLVVKVEDIGGRGGINGKVYLQAIIKEDELLEGEYSRLEALPSPDWAKDAVIYEVYIRSYSPEGDFNGLTNDLPRLREMGINCIWLMPIFPIGEAKRKGSLGSPYSILDYKAVNPEFGTEDDFRDLIEKAHALGIKVILDIACNHTAWDNYLITEHPDWYTRNKEGEIVSPNDDWTDVADLNYDNNDLREYMWNILEYWVQEYDVDGYRMDVAELIPDDFWNIALSRSQNIKPDLLILAEGSHPRLHLNGFHLTYAWNTCWIFYKILRYGASARKLYDVLEKEHYRYPSNSLRMRFSENHDLKRVTGFLGIQEAKVAAVLTFTLPGIPMIYAGQEVGATEKPPLFEKSVVDWEKPDRGFYELYSALIKLREDYPVLRYGKYIPVKNSQPKHIFSFARVDSNKSILIVVNMSSKNKIVSLDIREILNDRSNDSLKLLFGDTSFTLDNSKLKVEFLPFSYCLLEIQ